MSKYTESDLEQATLEWLSELGYSVVGGPEIAPPPDGERPERKSYSDVVLVERLQNAINRLNPDIPEGAREDALRKVLRVSTLSPQLAVNNKAFHAMLRDGVDVEYQRTDGSIAGDKVKLLDLSKPDKNDFLAVNQYTVIENRAQRRPDVVIFINGLPVAVIELKNPADTGATVKGAFNQIQTYKSEIPSLFAYNELAIISDGLEARAGTISSNMEWFTRWRTIEGQDLAPNSVPQLEVLLKGIFEKQRLLDIINNFVVFETDGEKISKKVAAYHQYHATNKAVSKTMEATGKEGDRRCGVVWHTQGSGKSLTMVFYAGKIIQALDNPTIVVLTDRNDLDDQLFGTFSRCSSLLRQTPKQAESREQLKEYLKVASGGVVFTTIQKFFPENGKHDYQMLSERTNIVVIADEAHRSQYDFIDGFARHMRDALPNASFIGFTGTPIELTDKNTRAVFGEYVDVYDVSQAVEDKATVPIYYEARLAKISLKEEERPKIDPEFEELTEGEEVEKKEKLKSKWARLEALVGAPKRISLIAKDLVEHFETRLSAVDGKGMVVAMSRRIAVELYNELVKLRPNWASDDDRDGFLKVVMTGSAADPLDWQKHIRTKQVRHDIANRMKDPNDKLKLVIVRDMWLTGFDVPCLHTMYIDKPMKGHGLMQTVARVNRVFKDKQGGLIVDYLGIAPELKDALAYYTDNDRKKVAIPQEEAVRIMLEKYEVVCQMYHGFEYKDKLKGSASERTRLIASAMDYILGLEDGQKRYIQAVTELSFAFSLSVPDEEALKIRDEVAFFQSVKAGIRKSGGGGGGGGPTDEDYQEAIKQIVSGAIVSDKVIDIYSATGIKTPDISILSDEFLAEVKDLPHKNLAFEMLKRLLNDEIVTMMRSNLVKSRSFAQMLEETIKKYQNRTIEAAQVIAELVELAKKIKKEKERGGEIGLSPEEVAFYDALCVNESAIRELGDKILMQIARELVSMLRKNTTIDWTIKENVQAKLRVYVKKLLRKYNYPPDKQESATQTVLEQANLLCKDWSGEN
ncbi:MAG: DEAD/DEAH box helicase [Candidatus Chisholmbacteria bacterium RIFCSPLOWO2_01_FULL_50_28]|uniref:Type I restriction enzyme endonuclease subunit n=1 Tax=Candidatus Chisholmbacteria bacterium RIFCSPHIGHO2_01_FULL_52_32 TaxID=1797591 RepID=A0A1G1VR30_9BACT|nr:MAG: DEAD/DEAH box helicase [Candidatus Chisholmbacteria bacterium RIFCSPHIGHO2_01_FULL_52_32]OGY19584.1 MAG: DEAD/DEAH box helicase [Candidatus Chisholmbacteria bacterium RIFCSPLOWO2_01_FULL_50_28]